LAKIERKKLAAEQKIKNWEEAVKIVSSFFR
jgi:hypothetical protein